MGDQSRAARRIAVLTGQSLGNAERRLVVTPSSSTQREQQAILLWGISGNENSIDSVLRPLCVEIGVTVHVLSPACNALFPQFGGPAQAEAAAKLTDVARREAEEELRRKCSEAVAWLGWPHGSWSAVSEIIGGWPSSLRWIQTLSAGADVLMEVVPDRITVTRAAGKFDHSIAEWVLTYILMHSKQMHRFQQSQREGKWGSKLRSPSTGVSHVRGACVLVVGYGSIGQRIAELCTAVGARVMATRRSSTTVNMQGNVEVHPSSDLLALLPAADFVVISLPLTTATRSSFDSPQLEAMKPRAALINIARGEIVNWDSVRSALQEGRLAAYYTDVTVPEPLPDGHGDWTVPNLYITPHVTFLPVPGSGDDAHRFFSNLQRFLSGDALEGRVDPKLGY